MFVDRAPRFIHCVYVVRGLLFLSAISMTSPEILIRVSFCSVFRIRGTKYYQSGACSSHHKECSGNILQKLQPLIQFGLQFPFCHFPQSLAHARHWLHLLTLTYIRNVKSSRYSGKITSWMVRGRVGNFLFSAKRPDPL